MSSADPELSTPAESGRRTDRTGLTRRAAIVISVLLLAAQLVLLAAPGVALSVVVRRGAEGGTGGLAATAPVIPTSRAMGPAATTRSNTS